MSMGIHGYSNTGLILTDERAEAVFKNYISELEKKGCNENNINKIKYALFDRRSQDITIIKNNKLDDMVTEVNNFLNNKESYLGTFYGDKKLMDNSFLMSRIIDSTTATYFYKEYDEYLERPIFVQRRYTDELTIIYPEKSMLPQSLLLGESYKTIDELVDEYKLEFGNYLPEDFDYMRNIAYIEVAGWV